MGMSKRPLQTFRFSPTLVAGAYATGNVMGAPVKLENAMEDPSGSAIVDSLAVIDLINAKADLEIHFFTKLVSPGADKGAFTLSATDASAWVGFIKLSGSTDYVSSAGQGLGMKSNIKAMLTGKQVTTITGTRNRDLYAVVVARGAFVAVSAADLTFLLGVEQG